MSPATVAHRARAAVAAHPDVAALGLVVLVASAVRLAFGFRVPVFLLHDSGSYYLPAHDLVHGLGFDISIRRPPVYPGFLAGTIVLLGEPLLAVALAQHLLGIASAGLVYAVGTLTFGRLAGLGAGLLTAANGTLLVAEHYVMPEALLLFLLLLTTIAAVLAIRRGSRRLYLASGFLLGLSILCKPVAQVLLPVLPFVVLVSTRSWRRTLAPTALVLAGAAVVALPWAARNWAVHGSFTTAGALGQTLVARTAKHDTGFRYYDARRAEGYGDQREATARQITQNGINQRLSDGVIYRRVQERLRLSDAEANGFMRDLALEVITERPGYYLRGTLEMTWRLLVGDVERLRTDFKTQNARLSRDEWDDRVEHLLSRPSPTHHNEFDRAEAVVDLYQPAALGPILPVLGLAGLAFAALAPGLRPALLLGLSALALLGVSAALDGPVARYRYPADPLIALMAMGGLVGVAGLVSRIVRGRLALARSGRDRALTPTPSRGERGLLPPLPNTQPGRSP